MLNQSQQEAVQNRSRNTLVLAGAGTGKTHVITHRIFHLVREGADPERILAVTFTNKAAKEMKRRLAKMGIEGLSWIGTFHGISARFLRQFAPHLGYDRNFTIYDDDSQMSVVKKIMNENPWKSKDDPNPKLVHSHISYAKECGYGPNELHKTPVPERMMELVQMVFEKYEEELRKSNAMDFADLIGNMVVILSDEESPPSHWLKGRFDHVLVDEFQDTNRVQLKLVDEISEKSKSVFVSGDDDQAIYGWRGANPGGMINFSRRDNTQVFKLERNYRSTSAILDCANRLIAKNMTRIGKDLWTDKDGSNVRLGVFANERTEAEYVASKMSPPWDNHAVLYRAHSLSRPIEEACRRNGIPYIIVGGTRFYDRMEIRDVLSYMRLAMNPRNDVDLLRIANKPPRGLGVKAISLIKKAALDWDMNIYDALSRLENRKVVDLRGVISKLIECRDEPLDRFYKHLLDITGYRNFWVKVERESKSTAKREEASERISNVEEMANDIMAYLEDHPGEGLEEYLEHVALVSKSDTETGPMVSLMTIHTAKGLEFPHVSLVGFEEGILPHINSIRAYYLDKDIAHIEEERRLAYVAMTRAKDHLDITLTRNRSTFGRSETSSASRFLSDLPRKSVDVSDMDYQDKVVH